MLDMISAMPLTRTHLNGASEVPNFGGLSTAFRSYFTSRSARCGDDPRRSDVVACDPSSVLNGRHRCMRYRGPAQRRSLVGIAKSIPSCAMAAAPAVETMIDEIILAIVRRLQPVPPKDAAELASAEIAAASAYFSKRGWTKNPATYHRQPPVLLDSDMAWGRTTWWPYNHETVSFPSGFRPRSTEPGADRWVSGGGNDTVSVRVLRRDGAS